jgi:hypothetical protein
LNLNSHANSLLNQLLDAGRPVGRISGIKTDRANVESAEPRFDSGIVTIGAFFRARRNCNFGALFQVRQSYQNVTIQVSPMGVKGSLPAAVPLSKWIQLSKFRTTTGFIH